MKVWHIAARSSRISRDIFILRCWGSLLRYFCYGCYISKKRILNNFRFAKLNIKEIILEFEIEMVYTE